MRIKFVSLACLSIFIASAALAWKVPIRHSACPSYGGSTSWKDYLAVKVPPAGALEGNLVAVEFPHAKKIADPAAIGNLRTDACYVVMYVPAIRASKRTTAGFWSLRVFYSGGNGPDIVQGQPGDPSNYEINVYGVTLAFDDQGRVFNKKGRHVGELSCTTRNECGSY